MVCTNHLLHRWSDPSQLPADDGPVGTAALTYARAGHVRPSEQLPMALVSALAAAAGAMMAHLIPAEALQNGPAGSFVYIARTDGTVEMRPVRIGAGGEGATLVVSEGLVAGERVVIDGQLRLTPGARFSVRFKALRSPPSPKPAA